ncbi:MAG: allantoate amidohydrolase [Pirellulales bacterium]|nr:allantoate amidohydrolase [Pirellulales bacterium]
MDRLATEILDRCDALARCSDEEGRITRIFCSPAMREAHRLVVEWMKSAGMAPRLDAAGNLIGTYLPPGCDSRRRVMIGSHLDTVADAGRYDGILGVMMGIAAVESLRERGVALPWAVEVIAFSDEEGVRFAAPFIGSRALAGTLDAGMLALRDDDGVSMGEALEQFGAKPQAAVGTGECAIEAGSVVAYLEPHIEQGPLLELVREPIGVVTAIAGQTRMTLEWTGEGGHAGTVPMMQRYDPLLAACRWTMAVDKLGREMKGLVATVGRVEVDPNVPNCIPRRVRASLDVRHSEDAVRHEATRQLLELAERIAAESRLTFAAERDHEHAATAMDEELTERWANVIASSGHEPQRLVSGAGHDAGVMATVAPTAMLFVRSPGGVSHHPAEAVLHGDVAAGLAALVQFIEEIANA